MRKYLLLLPVVALLAMGMGNLGLSGEDTPHKPSRNFTGTVTDRSNVAKHVTHMHCEGKLYIYGYLGEMRVKMPFDNLMKVQLNPGPTGYADGVVTLRDGQTQQLRFKNLTRCYGDADLGQIMVRIKDLKLIEFDTPPPPKEEPSK